MDKEEVEWKWRKKRILLFIGKTACGSFQRRRIKSRQRKGDEDMRPYRKQLEKIFCRKLGRELDQFKQQMMEKDKEEIYCSAYQIDSVICIYEALIELSGRIAEEILEAVTALPGLLGFLYNRWMNYEDSHMEDIAYCLNGGGLPGIRGRYRERRQGKTERMKKETRKKREKKEKGRNGRSWRQISLPGERSWKDEEADIYIKS